MNLKSVFTCLVLSESNFDRWDKIIGENLCSHANHKVYSTCPLLSASVSVCEKIRIIMQQAGDGQLVRGFAFVFLFSLVVLSF